MHRGASIFSLLGFMGVTAFCITIPLSYFSGEVQLILETPQELIFKVTLAYIGFAIMNFTTYSFTPWFIDRSGAALLSISNLTTAIWSMLADILLFQKSFRWAYAIAFTIEIGAILLFCLSEPKEDKPKV